MLNKITIGFVFAIALLATSEYMLLQEIYYNQRLLRILLCLSGILSGSAMFIYFFIKYRKASDES